MIHTLRGELEFALPVVSDRRDVSARARYAHFLKQHRDPRHELFELEDQLEIVDGEARVTIQKRLDLLLQDERMRAFWDGFGSLAAIRNCGSAKLEPGAVRFTYECPKHWSTLEHTHDAGIRRCSACSELVYLCKTREEVEARAREGACIAVTHQTQDRITTPLVAATMGRPDSVQAWARRLFPDERG